MVTSVSPNKYYISLYTNILLEHLHLTVHYIFDTLQLCLAVPTREYLFRIFVNGL